MNVAFGSTLTYGTIRDYAYNQTRQRGLIVPQLQRLGLDKGFWFANVSGMVEIKQGEQYQLWLTFDRDPFRLEAFYRLVYID